MPGISTPTCILLVNVQMIALSLSLSFSFSQTKAASTSQKRPNPNVKGTPIKTGTATRCRNYMTKLYISLLVLYSNMAVITRKSSGY